MSGIRAALACCCRGRAVGGGRKKKTSILSPSVEAWLELRAQAHLHFPYPSLTPACSTPRMHGRPGKLTTARQLAVLGAAEAATEAKGGVENQCGQSFDEPCPQPPLL